MSDFKRVIKVGRRRPLFIPGETARAVALGRAELERMLPHRDPFLLLDGIDAVDLEVGAVRGSLRINPDDPVLRGHFPGDPVYPGVFQIEAIGQLGICLQHLLASKSHEVGPGETPRRLRLLKVHHALFQGEVRPGDEVSIIATSIEEGDYVATCAGQVVVGDEVKALAIYEVFMLDD
ncbi:MAG: beta-hydroxyacyl-ACP dehydratase [Myxococcales bacterium]|nr:beta-hydroxyacyl-ACP dehydratase [Myxococcales bacterium]MCB9750664.1 beta-hydroxyacyl-ACP dehydratase [Myxococcales bacterium]